MLKVVRIKDDPSWDQYVFNNAMSNPYQASDWLKIINSAYDNKCYPLAVVRNQTQADEAYFADSLKGILPLVFLEKFIFGKRLVSLPYFDHGGILTDSVEGEERLLQAAIHLGKKLGAKSIELRQTEKLATFENAANNEKKPHARSMELEPGITAKSWQSSDVTWSLKKHKVRLLLSLPGDSKALMKSFKSKLRSQIKRPIKAGLEAKIGGVELLNDFYSVFSINMRDLGSPVHSKALPRCVLDCLNDEARVVMVYHKHTPVAASLMVGFNGTMINPWSSALRQYSKDSPNMLLYWTMLSYAANHGYKFFDFGRSTPGEGTYRFKAQWGAEPHPMYWYTIHLDKSKPSDHVENETSISKKRALAVQLWQKLPVPITRIIGPPIRKHIDL
jgi:FemAB-related protein (PEP-CTERM system-associated)